MSIYKSTQYGWSNIETYIVSLYNGQNDFFISKIIILRKISKIFEKFLSPDGFDFLHSLYGRPSFFEILWRKVTIGISFGFSAIESSGSKFSSMLSSCMTTNLAYFHKMATNTWLLQPVNDSIQTSNLIHWMKLSLRSLLVEQTKNIVLFPSFVPLDRTFYNDHLMCSHLQSHLYSAFDLVTHDRCYMGRWKAWLCIDDQERCMPWYWNSERLNCRIFQDRTDSFLKLRQLLPLYLNFEAISDDFFIV